MSAEENSIPIIVDVNSTDSSCKCDNENEKVAEIKIPPYKVNVLSTVTRTEKYLRERRIPELIRFLMTKLIVESPEREREFLEQLLDDCMLFRAGHGPAPVLYDKKHLTSVVQSFDPGDRGWLRAGQVRRAYITLGWSPPELNDEIISTDEVLNMLTTSQEAELIDLILAGFLE